MVTMKIYLEELISTVLLTELMSSKTLLKYEILLKLVTNTCVYAHIQHWQCSHSCSAKQ